MFIFILPPSPKKKNDVTCNICLYKCSSFPKASKTQTYFGGGTCMLTPFPSRGSYVCEGQGLVVQHFPWFLTDGCGLTKLEKRVFVCVMVRMSSHIIRHLVA